MKKLIALLMVCGFAFAFVACGGGSKENASEGGDTTATETPTVEADTTADTTAVEGDTTAN